MSDRAHPPIASLIALIAAVVILLAFLLMPWRTISATPVTGLRMLTIEQGGSQNEIAFIFLVPIAGIGGVVSALWGLIGRGNTSVVAMFLSGLLGLTYYLVGIFFRSSPSPILYDGGYWIALISVALLLCQPLFSRRRKPMPVTGDVEHEKEKRTPQSQPESVRRSSGGCLLAPLLAPIRALSAQMRFALILLALTFGLCAGCALLVPTAYQAIVGMVRSAGLQVAVYVIEAIGKEADKQIAYEVEVSAFGIVNRDMGIFSLAFGEGARVSGKVRIALGADLVDPKNRQYGILSCDIDTSKLEIEVGRAPLSGTAFNRNEIIQKALGFLKEQAASIAINEHWMEARTRLLTQLNNRRDIEPGLVVPEQPTLAKCP